MAYTTKRSVLPTQAADEGNSSIIELELEIGYFFFGIIKRLNFGV